MGRKFKFPPTIHHHKRGYDFCRLGDRDVYLGSTGSPEVEQAYRRLLAELAAGGTRASRGPKVIDLLSAYAKAIEGQYDPRQQRRIDCALVPVAELYGDTPAADFGPLALQAVRQTFIDHGYARTYINALVHLIRQAWRWGAKAELVPAASHQALLTVDGLNERSGVPNRPKVPPVPFDVVDRTLPLLFPEIRDMVQLQRLTGMRPGEVVLLRPLDVEQHFTTVGGVKLWLFTPHKHKNDWRGQRREIPLGPQAQAVLLPYLDREPESYCFCPREVVKRRWRELDRSPRRPSEREPGAHYSTETYCRHIARAIKFHNAKDPGHPIPHWSPRQIRKAVATQIGRDDLDAAACLLGHASPDTTALHYRQRLAKAADVAARLG